MAWLMGQVQPKLTCTRKADQGGWCRAGSVRGAAGEVRCLGRSRRRRRQTIWCAVQQKRCMRRRTAVAETPSWDRRAAHGLKIVPAMPIGDCRVVCRWHLPLSPRTACGYQRHIYEPRYQGEHHVHENALSSAGQCAQACSSALGTHSTSWDSSRFFCKLPGAQMQRRGEGMRPMRVRQARTLSWWHGVHADGACDRHSTS